MPKRNTISKYPGNLVDAEGSNTTAVGADPIPAGRTFRITCFGGAMAKAGKIELRLRTQVTPSVKWRTLRCIIGPGHGHFESFAPIVGDGTIAALEIVRTNDETTNEKINAWLEGYRSRES